MFSSLVRSKIKKEPALLVILDGWGIAPPNRGNAVTLAKTKTMNWLYRNYPSIKSLCAHGRCAGLPDPQVGNSESGHLNIGAGRLVESENTTITEEIKNGDFFKNPIFLEAINYLKYHKSKLHLMGLITENDSAHSSPDHWMAMLKFLLNEGVENIYIHLFTDGRDSSQHAAIKLIKRFERKVNGVRNHNHVNDKQKIIIASVCGRFYAMDRKKNWPVVEKVYDAIVLGRSEVTAEKADEAIVQAYNRGETDEFVKPTVIVDKNSKPLATVEDRDVVIFMNLRSDRARELTKVFAQKDFTKMNPNSFRRKKYLENLLFVAMTSFGPDLDNIHTAYPDRMPINTLPWVLKGLNQFYIAETEKYAHVTYFFNGGYDRPVVGENRIALKSPSVEHYNMVPEMGAFKITAEALKILRKADPDFMVINFANPDMLGHTGNLEAAVKGITVVDQCLAKILEALKRKNGWAFITADHGNAEEMINLKTGEIDTKHSINPVPAIIFHPKYKFAHLREGGVLGDVAPTVLEIMGIKQPTEMTGKSLII